MYMIKLKFLLLFEGGQPLLATKIVENCRVAEYILIYINDTPNIWSLQCLC